MDKLGLIYLLSLILLHSFTICHCTENNDNGGDTDADMKKVQCQKCMQRVIDCCVLNFRPSNANPEMIRKKRIDHCTYCFFNVGLGCTLNNGVFGGPDFIAKNLCFWAGENAQMVEGCNIGWAITDLLTASNCCGPQCHPCINVAEAYMRFCDDNLNVKLLGEPPLSRPIVTNGRYRPRQSGEYQLIENQDMD